MVLDEANCHWCKRAIGMPSVVKVGNRLALFYDASPDGADGNMGRDIGLAQLPLRALNSDSEIAARWIRLQPGTSPDRPTGDDLHATTGAGPSAVTA